MRVDHRAFLDVEAGTMQETRLTENTSRSRSEAATPGGFGPGCGARG
jgi:hypothetical protein